MKASYPGEEQPLCHFPELTKRLTVGVDKLVRQGVPYMVIDVVADGIHQFRSAIAADPIAESLHSLLITLGIARPRPLAA
jgi:hypothetical protein